MSETLTQSRCKIALVLSVIALSLYILQPFCSALVWGCILAITFFPVFARMSKRFNTTFSAALMVIGIIAVVVTPFYYLLTQAGQEIPGLIGLYHSVQEHGIQIPKQLEAYPRLYTFLNHWLSSHPIKDQAHLFDGASHYALNYALKATHTVGGVVESVGIALMTTFFLLMYHETLLEQMRCVGHSLLGEHGEDLAHKAITSVRGAVSGLVLVGLGEGVLCVPVLMIAHIPHAAILAISVGIAAIIPFCAPVILLIICAYAFLMVSVKAALISAIGCMVILFIGDHFVRPSLIGSANKLPFIVVMLSILGGLHAFGILGLFVGPAVFTVGLTLWKTLVDKENERVTDGIKVETQCSGDCDLCAVEDFSRQRERTRH